MILGFGEMKGLIVLIAFCFSSVSFGQEVKLGLPVGHSKHINTLNCSSDGKYIVTSSNDGSAKVWDQLSDRLIYSLEGHKDDVNFASFSPDGRSIITTSDDSTAIIWKVEDGQPIHILKCPSKFVESAVFSSNGEFVATISNTSELKRVIVWEVKTGNLITEFGDFSDYIRYVEFNSTNNNLLVFSEDSVIKLWDILNDQLLLHLKSDIVSFNSDFSSFITTSKRTIVFRSGETGKITHKLNSHNSDLKEVVFDNTGTSMVSLSKKGEIFIWDLKTKKVVHSISVDYFKPFHNVRNHLSISPSGKLLVLIVDHNGFVWDTETGKQVSQIDFYSIPAPINKSQFSPDGSYFIGIHERDDPTLVVWETDNWTNKKTVKFEDRNSIIEVSFTSDNKSILINQYPSYRGNENHIEKILLRTGVITPVFKSKMGHFYNSIQNSSGRYMASIWNDSNQVIIRDIKTGLIHNKLLGHKDRIMSLKFNKQGDKLLTSSLDRTAKFWSIHSRTALKTFKGSGRVNYAAFGSNEDNIIMCGQDGKLIFRNLINGEINGLNFGNDVSVNKFEFYPEYNKSVLSLFSHSYDINTSKVYRGFLESEIYEVEGDIVISTKGDVLSTYTSLIHNLETGKETLDFSTNGHVGLQQRFSLCGRFIVSIGGKYYERKNIHIIDSKTGELKYKLKGHTDDIVAFCFNSDGRKIASVSKDKTLKIWDIGKGVLLQTLSGHHTTIQSVMYGDNDNIVITSSIDGTIIYWDIASSSMIVQLLTISVNSSIKTIRLTNDNYYSGDKGVVRTLYYTKRLQIFPFSQFDLKYNRPDIILDRLGYASDDKIESYRRAYLKRLQKMNFTEDMLKADFHLPEASITNEDELPSQTEQDQLSLNIHATDSKYPLDRINVWINNVPIYGVNGISLRSKMTQDFDSTIQLQLNEDDNKIEVSVLNQAGAESYKETIYMTCTKPAPKPNLYFVGIGVKDYADQNMNLKFSDKDIRDIADMYGKNKSYGEIYIDTFLNASVTKDILPQIRKRLESSTIHDQVIFMYSGHGILDDSLDYFLTTHDIDFFNPKEKGIPYEAVDALMDNIPARKKLVLIDACNSGEVDKDELEVENAGSENSGVTAEAIGPKGDLFKKYTTKTNSFEMMQELFTDLRRGTGATVISSSSGKYFSFEDKKYQNGVYTYALKLGLEGAADKDDNGEISVTELKEYLYTKVEELTNGKQKPTARQENLEYDFRVW